MGSPLGPTYADFYMSSIESYLLSQQNRATNPIFYVRYVDDILEIFNAKRHVKLFINRLQTASVLNFTYELSNNQNFHFLDVNLEIDNSYNFKTSVFVKPTDKGLLTHLLLICIKSLLSKR